ncbi:cupin domain-containing protein [Lentibacillus saliphilus]|uniref:cupin domain-containing protein n=1 Tax=Lentibacillus saliphilus TaxID=2737028 RepID=UPI001FE7EFC6|nr:cupin domain-containing protein [Lentibacillus saliphilus]
MRDLYDPYMYGNPYQTMPMQPQPTQFPNQPQFVPHQQQQMTRCSCGAYRPAYHMQDYYNDMQLKDYGGRPFVVNIEEATTENDLFRIAVWTGKHLQVTLMSINPGEDIGLEIHPDVDQFIRIEEGQGMTRMGDRKDNLTFEANVGDDDAIMVPAGKWHNIINTGNTPLKLYSIYAPPEHPFGTVHPTKADAIAAEQY